MEQLMQPSINLGKQIKCMFEAFSAPVMLDFQFILEGPQLFLKLMESTDAFSGIRGLQLKGPTIALCIRPSPEKGLHTEFWAFVDKVLGKLEKVDALKVDSGINEIFMKSLLESVHFNRIRVLVLGYSEFTDFTDVDVVVKILKKGLYSLHRLAVSFQGIGKEQHAQLMTNIENEIVQAKLPITIKHIEFTNLHGTHESLKRLERLKRSCAAKNISYRLHISSAERVDMGEPALPAQDALLAHQNHD